MFTHKEFIKAQEELDIVDITRLAEEVNPVFFVLSEKDKRDISQYFRSKYDWDYSAREQLLNATKNYMLEEFPKEVVNVVFDTNSGLTDETQFDIESIWELGMLWVDFCKENQIDPSCFTYYYPTREPSLDDDISYDRLLQILRCYIEQDLNAAAESHYIIDVLRDRCGCTDNEIVSLGCGAILEVEHGTNK